MSSDNEISAEVVFEYTGKGCVVPKDVTIVRFHPSVVEVENRAFERCCYLKEVEFNDGLKKIGQWAFHKCTSLSGVTFPSTITEISGCAFYGCDNLSDTSITLPSTVIEIGRSAFDNCNTLREVLLNEELQKIGEVQPQSKEVKIGRLQIQS